MSFTPISQKAILNNRSKARSSTLTDNTAGTTPLASHTTSFADVWKYRFDDNDDDAPDQASAQRLVRGDTPQEADNDTESPPVSSPSPLMRSSTPSPLQELDNHQWEVSSIEAEDTEQRAMLVRWCPSRVLPDELELFLEQRIGGTPLKSFVSSCKHVEEEGVSKVQISWHFSWEPLDDIWITCNELVEKFWDRAFGTIYNSETPLAAREQVAQRFFV